MKRGLLLLSVLLILAIFATLWVPQASAGKKKAKVPPVPEIPASELPASLEIPAEAEALLNHPGLVDDAFRVVVVFLEMTPNQAQALRQLMRTRHEAIAPLVEQIHERQELIREQLGSGAPDPTVIGQLVIEIHQLLQQVRAAQEAFLQGFASLLNEEQQQRYNAMRLADQLAPFLPAFRLLRLV